MSTPSIWDRDLVGDRIRGAETKTLKSRLNAIGTARHCRWVPKTRVGGDCLRVEAQILNVSIFECSHD
jgi:hypothetical protein